MSKKPAPKPTKAKHPFPKAYFAAGFNDDEGDCGAAVFDSLDAAASNADTTKYVAEYTLTRVLKVNRGVTFEEVK